MLMLSDVAQLAGGRLAGADAEVTRVVTDSRAAGPGDLFVALKGEHFDAHDFVADVLAQGAAGALVRQDFALPGAALVQVDDTRLALGRLAAGWRARFELPLVGITGSNGKTTVKEMLTAILAAHAGRDTVLATAGNFNNDIGLPLTLLGLNAGHRYAVIEMGMNHFGEIRYLTGLARPRVALVNNALRAHLGGGFSGTADIARAKSEIFEGLAEDGVAVINADDPHATIFRAAAAGHRLLSFGLGEADVNARDVTLSDTAAHFVLCSPQGDVAVALPAPGEHNVRNALAAAAAALALEVPLAAIAAGLAGFAGVKGRLQRKRAGNGATLIDDTYNANPDSMKAGIDVLLQALAPRWFVMGDIGELGENAPALHAEVGAYARERGLDALLTLGDLSRHAAAAFGAAANHFDTLDALLSYLDSHLPADATVLVKGSRFMRMERVVEHLTGQRQEH
ncbi:UDP-N-acetylmuramoylalanyl-D-glutamyl-2, 6-diaminopimelate--D-alanyl-D-alanine ligase [Pseudogulbenkiania sp. NH8B]|uniref:UDP-N-acetylmuramoyl-tripeptide--D-alanyl-D- alanine ligase n=1 Tax=Pseudogulbenkiania sp. (strain NH8B) TaxID=748280 RepID=UPI0002279103|nr:UDP-N-acetylmuramoyl-tripeptide--D-alanyl-D-alanine ligase [Pseudogulbenkiania sp. NH8B]BAK75017.1 UDP-N-acetylmuramoylalanyl-D-glutamyl-2, 6-diaminopimelate--D-alanyl-D-alanine ligase [Pseudogulbenkiania sp. NH8B]